MNRKHFLAALAALASPGGDHRQHRCPGPAGPIKIGEVNSYKAQPAFLEPYKKGMELAVEEINAAGGVLRPQGRADHPRRQRQPGRRGARGRRAGLAREGRRADRRLPVATSAWR